MSESDRRNILQRWVGAFGEIISDIIEAVNLDDPTVRAAVLGDLGLNPDTGATIDVPQDSLDSITRYAEAADPDLDAFTSVMDDILLVGDAVADFVAAARTGDAGLAAGELVHQLFTLFALNYLRYRLPVLYWWARFLGFIEEEIQVQVVGTWHPERIGQFGSNTLDYLSSLYRALRLSEDEETIPGVFLLSDLLAAVVSPTIWGLAYLIKWLGLADFSDNIQFFYGWESDPDSGTETADKISERAFTIVFSGDVPDGLGGTLGSTSTITVLLVPEKHGGPGVLISLKGNLSVEYLLGEGPEDSDPLRLALKFTGPSVPAIVSTDFFITGSDVQVDGPIEGGMMVTLDRPNAASQPPLVLPSRTGTRLELARPAIRVELATTGASIRVVAHDSALVLSGGDADSFAGSALPGDEMRLNFDLGLAFDNKRGLTLEGSTGLAATIPMSRSIGPVRIRTLQLALSSGSTDTTSQLQLTVAATLTVAMGPVTATIDRMGFTLGLGLGQGPELLLSMFAIGDIGYKYPDGVGLRVDGDLVTGGGYLFFDPDQEQYAGTIQLQINKQINVSAIGLINTRLPDGQRGFSLLIIITAEGFTPINLPLGFRLTGIGGLLGINRRADVEVLRAGLKSKILDDVLFPENPVANAPRLISNLRRVFPAQDDQYLFAPLVQVAWGAAALVTMELAFALEFPSPTRFLLLGQLRVSMPSRDNELIRLRVDAITEINFDSGQVNFDATLHDSKLLDYALDGDVAARGGWKGNQAMILAAGGLNPRFPRPERFPELSAIRLILTEGDRARLEMQFYAAITPNTLQAGAAFSLVLRAASFSIEGSLDFDVLIQRDPFSFVADIEAGITLKWHGRTLMGVWLEMTLSGLAPLRAQGTAKFKIWRWSKSVSFDRHLGGPSVPPRLPLVDPLLDLLAALRDPANWRTLLPATGQALVTVVDDPAATGLRVHPLGELSVRQAVVPLNIEIDLFGGAVPSGDRRFAITDVQIGGDPVGQVQAVSDYFAPAQFLALSDDEKLARPSFEPLDAGITLGLGDVAFGGQAPGSELLMASTDLEYETCILNENGNCIGDAPPYRPPTGVLDALVALGPAANAPLKRTGRRKYEVAGPRIQLRPATFAVASTGTLTASGSADAPQAGLSFTAAAQVLQAQGRRGRGRPTDLQVVASHELAEVA